MEPASKVAKKKKTSTVKEMDLLRRQEELAEEARKLGERHAELAKQLIAQAEKESRTLAIESTKILMPNLEAYEILRQNLKRVEMVTETEANYYLFSPLDFGGAVDFVKWHFVDGSALALRYDRCGAKVLEFVYLPVQHEVPPYIEKEVRFASSAMTGPEMCKKFRDEVAQMIQKFPAEPDLAARYIKSEKGDFSIVSRMALSALVTPVFLEFVKLVPIKELAKSEYNASECGIWRGHVLRSHYRSFFHCKEVETHGWFIMYLLSDEQRIRTWIHDTMMERIPDCRFGFEPCRDYARFAYRGVVDAVKNLKMAYKITFD